MIQKTFDNDAISFAERILTLLNQGSFTSTYKYAVLLAMMDIVLEQTSENGIPPDFITTRQLAEKVIEVYWPHTNLFRFNKNESRILLGLTGKGGKQAEIIKDIVEFRKNPIVGENAPLFTSKHQDKNGFIKLVDKVEWKLIEMPLPKLQRIGSQLRPFIYTIHWNDLTITKKMVNAYQRDEQSDFDNRIILHKYVGEYLVRLNTLLRPLIQREWAQFVAKVNVLEESKLQSFLFNSTRAGAAILCHRLSELQNHYCFYCLEKIGNSENTKPEVDHFIPWARHPNDSITNYVVAHSRCNRYKRDHLAANQHVSNWINRMKGENSRLGDLKIIADEYKWDWDEHSSKGVAAAIYQHLQPEVELWKIDKEFEVVGEQMFSSLFNTEGHFI